MYALYLNLIKNLTVIGTNTLDHVDVITAAIMNS